MESPVKNKSELLEQLKINRQSEETQAGGSKKAYLGIAIASASLGALLSYLFLEQPPAPLASDKAAQSAAHSDNNTVAENTNLLTNSTPIVTSESILNASGYITARRMATVSAEIMGLITEVTVEEGMQVAEGQILARLDSTLAQVNLDLAKAQIESLEARRESAQASLDEAKRQYQRVMNNQYSSEADRTRSKTDLDTATAQLANAVADIKVARFDVIRQKERLDDHTIRAPFEGVVTMKNAQPGEIVAPSSAGGGFTRTGICTIVDIQSLEIEVDVNESFIGRVFPGQIVEAHLDAYPDWKIPASVIAIIPTADRAKATVSVRIKIETLDNRILPDMGVKVAFLKED